MYHDQLGTSGYTIFQLARTNSRGDGNILIFFIIFVLLLVEYGVSSGKDLRVEYC